MKNLNILLLITFLLSSCAPAVTAVPTIASQSILPTLTSTPKPIATQTPSPTETLMPTPTQIGGGSGKLIFEYYKIAYEKDFPNLKGEVNIFTSNWDGSNLMPITNGLDNYNFIESIAPDGQTILVYSTSNLQEKADLYVIRLKQPDLNPLKLAGGIEATNSPHAIFLGNTQLAYIGQGSQGYGFYTINIDGTDEKKIGVPTGKYPGILSSDQSRVYWRTSQKENFKDASGVLYTYGDFQTLWWTNLDGSGQGKLEANGQQIISSQYAFSPDGKSIAWISTGLEEGCSLPPSGLAFWTPFIRNGAETRNAQKPSMFLHQNSPHFGKTIDIAYVEDYVRQCFVMHVASLSNMDNDIKISLIPPFDPSKDDFFYHKEYAIIWSPDSSKILAYDGGGATRYLIGVTDHYPLAIYEVSLKDTNPKLTLLKILSNSSMVQSGNSNPHLIEDFTLFSFSPDGRLLLFTKHNPHENFHSADINILTLETMNFIDGFRQNIIPDAQERRVGKIFWLP